LRIFQSEGGYKIPCIDEFCLRNAGEAAIILNEPQIDPFILTCFEALACFAKSCSIFISFESFSEFAFLAPGGLVA